MRIIPRLAAMAGLVTVGVCLIGAPAGAHVGTSIDSVPAGSSTPLGLTIGHGCGESPTTSVAVQIPEGINNATAFAKAGWTVTSEKADLATPVTSSHGEEVTDRVAVITFTAEEGNALPTDLRDTFTVNFAAPDTPGEKLYFKTIQTCETGENAWIDEWDGTGEEPESPAPSIEVTEAEAEGGHGHGAAEAEDETETTVAEAEAEGDHAEEAGAAAGTSSESGGDGDGTPLAIVALVVGGLGLAAGGLALSKSRSAS